MVASRRIVTLLAGLGLAGCATSDPDEVGQAESTVAVSTEQRPTDPGAAAVERRVTIDQFVLPNEAAFSHPRFDVYKAAKVEKLQAP